MGYSGLTACVNEIKAKQKNIVATREKQHVNQLW